MKNIRCDRRKLFEKIGFIGLGNMGLPMSKNLLQENFTVYGMDLNKEAELALHHAGGTIGISVEKMVEECDAILTSLPSSKAAEEVFLGKRGSYTWLNQASF